MFGMCGNTPVTSNLQMYAGGSANSSFCLRTIIDDISLLSGRSLRFSIPFIPAMGLSLHPRVGSKDVARLKLARPRCVTGAVLVMCTMLIATPRTSSTSVSRHTAEMVPAARVSGSASHTGLSCRLNGGYHDQQCPTCSYTLNQKSPTEVALSCAGEAIWPTCSIRTVQCAFVWCCTVYHLSSFNVGG